MKENLVNILQSGCEALALPLSTAQQEQLITYALALEKWNKTYNLTAVRDIESILKRHVLDALSVVKSVDSYSPKTLADIGTGGGVPGVILAIMLPQLQVYLVESVGKKCRFLRHVTTLLGLSDRVLVVQQRVEAWQPQAPLSLVICRAFTSLENFVTITRHLGNADTVWLAMKADNTAAEVAQLPDDFSVAEKSRLSVPFESAARYLLVLKRED